MSSSVASGWDDYFISLSNERVVDAQALCKQLRSAEGDVFSNGLLELTVNDLTQGRFSLWLHRIFKFPKRDDKTLSRTPAVESIASALKLHILMAQPIISRD